MKEEIVEIPIRSNRDSFVMPYTSIFDQIKAQAGKNYEYWALGTISALRDKFIVYRAHQIVPGLKLWEFILELLLIDERQNLLTWTGEDFEFKILSAEGFAKSWGERKMNAKMNYETLSRALRQYYSKGLLEKERVKFTPNLAKLNFSAPNMVQLDHFRSLDS